MKVIFLDIDGVLNTNTTKKSYKKLRGVEKSLLGRMRHIVARTQAKIILTSAWGIHFDDQMIPVDDYGNYLYRKFWERSIWMHGKLNSANECRGKAIRKYLTANKGKISDWIVIDDTEFADYDEEMKRKHLVLVDGNSGLTERATMEAIKLLGCHPSVWEEIKE